MEATGVVEIKKIKKSNKLGENKRKMLKPTNKERLEGKREERRSQVQQIRQLKRTAKLEQKRKRDVCKTCQTPIPITCKSSDQELRRFSGRKRCK